MTTRVLVISEYANKQDAGAGVLVFETISDLRSYEARKVHVLHGIGRYRPGGLRPIRLMNLALLHILSPLAVIFFGLFCFLTASKGKILVHSSPPLIHIPVLLLRRILRIPTAFWCMDTHPEMEARFLEQKGLCQLAKALRWLDKVAVAGADAVIVLDKAMAEEMQKRNGKIENISIIPPWVDFSGPSHPLRKISTEPLRILYAGNYGRAHDLRPFFEELRSLEPSLLSKVHLTFAGLSPDAKKRIERESSELVCKIDFVERKASAHDLEPTMLSHSLGVVSLSSESVGTCCPSKMLTYLGYGLPILYFGPSGTLSAELCEHGWGIGLKDLRSLLQGEKDKLQQSEVRFEQPGPSSKRKLSRCIRGLGKDIDRPGETSASVASASNEIFSPEN